MERSIYMWELALCGLLVALFAWRLCQQAGEQDKREAEAFLRWKQEHV